MHYTFTIEQGNFTDAGQASSSVKRTLKQLGVDPVNIKRTVVALFEAEINAVAHAYGGTIDVDIDGIYEEVHRIGGLFIPAHVNKGTTSLTSQLGFSPPDLKADGLEINRFITKEEILKKFPKALR